MPYADGKQRPQGKTFADDIKEAFNTDLRVESPVQADMARTQMAQKLGNAINKEIKKQVPSLVQKKLDDKTITIPESGEENRAVVNATVVNLSVAGAPNQLQYNGGEILAASTKLWFDETNDGLYVSGTVYAQVGDFSSGLTGALNVLPDGSSTIIAGTNITTATGSDGQITINTIGSGDINQVQLTDGTNLSASNGLWYLDGSGLYASGTLTAETISCDNIAAQGSVHNVQISDGTNLSASNGLWFKDGYNEGLYVSGAMDVSGTLTVISGTLTDLAVRFKDDENTGMYQSAVNYMELVCGGNLIAKGRWSGFIQMFGVANLYANNIWPSGLSLYPNNSQLGVYGGHGNALGQVFTETGDRAQTSGRSISRELRQSAAPASGNATMINTCITSTINHQGSGLGGYKVLELDVTELSVVTTEQCYLIDGRKNASSILTVNRDGAIWCNNSISGSSLQTTGYINTGTGYKISNSEIIDNGKVASLVAGNFSSGLSGALNVLTDGTTPSITITAVATAATGLFLSTGSNGQIIIDFST